MKKLTTKLMIAATVLVVTAGAASAQTMRAAIPFEFRVGNRVMAAGTYRVSLSQPSGAPIFELSNVHSGRSAIVVGQVPDDPRKEWEAEGNSKLTFACGSGRCALAELWAGPGSHAYKVLRPKRETGEDEYLTVIPMQRDKGE
jgi:hypothetical protein